MIKSLFISLSLAWTAQSQNSLTPARLQQAIKVSGPKAVIAKLIANKEHDWEIVIREIATGKSDWLDLAPALAPGTDASATLGLRYALSRALLKSPSHVLTIISNNKLFTAEDVCDVPYIEPSKKVIDTYLRQAKAAVNKVNQPSMSRTKKACLSRLNN